MLQHVFSGEAWFHWQASSKQLPVLALSYNHRAQAFYRADAQVPDNRNVESVRKRGLKRVRVMASSTPPFVLEFLCSVHNRFHKGSSASVIELAKSALRIEASWRSACDQSGMTYNNPGYQKAYEAGCIGWEWELILRRMEKA